MGDDQGHQRLTKTDTLASTQPLFDFYGFFLIGFSYAAVQIDPPFIFVVNSVSTQPNFKTIRIFPSELIIERVVAQNQQTGNYISTATI